MLETRVDEFTADGCSGCPFEGDQEPGTALRPPHCTRALARSISAGRTNLSAMIDHELRADEDPSNLGGVLTPSPVRSQPSTTCAGALIAQVTGICRIEQFGTTCTLYPGDWCLIDGRQPFDCKTLEKRNECLLLRLEGPFEPQKLLLLHQSASRRCSSRSGVSRILIRLIIEAANQTDLLHPCRRTRLRRAIVQMIWDAAREQLNTPLALVHPNVTGARVKAYIERHLADPELSVNGIAASCAMSVRTIHRAFQSDPAGSVSAYVWARRLDQCRAALRDASQAHRSITDVCFSWGFNSTSHFSRLFKERFGVSPREYRAGFSSVIGASSVSAHCLALGEAAFLQAS
jgi:AraC family transcriptional regulator, positive regulator of tynA and feaB